MGDGKPSATRTTRKARTAGCLSLYQTQRTYSGAAIVAELPETNCGCEDGGEEPAESGIKMAQFRRELQPSASLGWTTRDAPHPASIVRSWFIHSRQPAHVPNLAWHKLAESTRASHARWLRLLVQMPIEWHKDSLGTAAVNVVLREQERAGWGSWGTVASALSSVASALRRLPQYSGSLHGLELKEDPVFADAQQLARVTKRHVASDAMTVAQYESMRTSIKDSRVRLLFTLAWAFAARLGDMRQVLGADVAIGDATTPGGQRVVVSMRKIFFTSN